MDCEQASPWLALYFDGELDRASSRELELHLDGCAACRQQLIELDTLRRQVRAAAPRSRAPEALRARITASTRDAPAPTERSRRRPRVTWLALAASWVVAFVLGGSLIGSWQHQRSDSDLLAHDLFASHWRALAANSPIDVVSSDRHTVKPWFAGKLAQAPSVVDLAAMGYPLVGGRLDYLGDQRVPVLVYRHGQHLIDVFVVPSSQAVNLAAVRQSDGYTAVRTRLGDQSAVIVSDMDASELQRLRVLLESAAP